MHTEAGRAARAGRLGQCATVRCSAAMQCAAVTYFQEGALSTRSAPRLTSMLAVFLPSFPPSLLPSISLQSHGPTREVLQRILPRLLLSCSLIVGYGVSICYRSSPYMCIHTHVLRRHFLSRYLIPRECLCKQITSCGRKE